MTNPNQTPQPLTPPALPALPAADASAEELDAYTLRVAEACEALAAEALARAAAEPEEARKLTTLVEARSKLAQLAGQINALRERVLGSQARAQYEADGAGAVGYPGTAYEAHFARVREAWERVGRTQHELPSQIEAAARAARQAEEERAEALRRLYVAGAPAASAPAEDIAAFLAREAALVEFEAEAALAKAAEAERPNAALVMLIEAKLRIRARGTGLSAYLDTLPAGTPRAALDRARAAWERVARAMGDIK